MSEPWPKWWWSLPLAGLKYPSWADDEVHRGSRRGVWPCEHETRAACALLMFYGRFEGCRHRITGRKVREAVLRQSNREARWLVRRAG